MSDFDGQKRIKYGEDSALPARFLTGLIFKHETRAILCHLFSPISLAFQCELHVKYDGGYHLEGQLSYILTFY